MFDELVVKHDLYENYTGELDSDKWYPEKTVHLFESWKDRKNRLSIKLAVN